MTIVTPIPRSLVQPSPQADRRRELRDLLLEFTTNELTAFTREHIFKRLTPAQKRELLAELQRQLES